MDKIIIRDLLVRGILGINPDERVERQDIVVNVVMWTDIRPAATADDVSLSINYYDTAERIIQHVESSNNYAVEKLAEEIAAIILDEFGAERVQVRVEKPSALRFAASVGVEIERGRMRE